MLKFVVGKYMSTTTTKLWCCSVSPSSWPAQHRYAPPSPLWGPQRWSWPASPTTFCPLLWDFNLVISYVSDLPSIARIRSIETRKRVRFPGRRSLDQRFQLNDLTKHVLSNKIVPRVTTYISNFSFCWIWQKNIANFKYL